MLPSCCLPDIIIIFCVFVLYLIKYYSTLCDYILCINIKCMEVGDGVYKIYVYVIHKCVVSVAIILGCLFSFNKYFHVTHAPICCSALPDNNDVKTHRKILISDLFFTFNIQLAREKERESDPSQTTTTQNFSFSTYVCQCLCERSSFSTFPFSFITFHMLLLLLLSNY